MYLWINLTDLQEIGTLGQLGSPLNFMVRPDLGDKMHLGCWEKDRGPLDQIYVVLECSPERADAITGGLQVVFSRKAKSKRPFRTRKTANLPGPAWRYIAK